MQLYQTLVIAVLLCTFVQFAHSEEKFYEELLVRHLPDGKLMTHFQFTTHWDVDRSDVDACKYKQPETTISSLFDKSLF